LLNQKRDIIHIFSKISSSVKNPQASTKVISNFQEIEIISPGEFYDRFM